MRVLVTGGCGFIGSHIVEHFCRLEEPSEVVVLDSLRTGHRHNLQAFMESGRVRIVEGSICDQELVASLCEGIDYVFHLAAMISVPESLAKPRECIELNVHGLLSILEGARLQGVKKVVLSSTCAIYGDEPTLPKREEMLPAPTTPYGVTKLDGEYYLEMYRQHYGVETTSLRYFNVYGPRQDPHSQYAAAVPIFIRRALKNEDVGIFGDGAATRDFVFVKDIVAANVLAATTPHMHGTFNVGRGESISVLELARKIVAATGSSSRIVHLPERAGDIRDSWSDISKIRSFGFTPSTDLEQGLQATIESLRVPA